VELEVAWGDCEGEEGEERGVMNGDEECRDSCAGMQLSVPGILITK
jgi:hypothetical protein